MPPIAGENWTITPTTNVVLKSGTHARLLPKNIRLQIGLPPDYHATNKAYDIVLCLDGFAFGGTFRETANLLRFAGEIPDVITVSIDLEVTSTEEWQTERAFILTPTKSDSPDLPASGTGGASQFLKALADEVLPYIDKNYRTIVGERTMAGHSLGALFAAWAIFESHGLFNRYLLSSPSLFWDDRAVFKTESNYAKTHGDLPARVFLSAGALEHAPDDTMVDDVRQFADALRSRKYPGLELTSIVFENENHYSVPSLAFSRGLRLLYAHPKVRTPSTL